VPLKGTAYVIFTILERAVVKVIVDFSGCLQFRGPGEMGGAYFSFSLLGAMVASFVVTHVYFSSLEDHEAAVMGESDAWKLVGGLGGGWLASFVLFFYLIEPGYVSSFFSLKTGYQYVHEKFRLGEDDERKASIFSFQPKMWLTIRDDVKTWTLENWERWGEEKPRWFTDAWKRKVDDDMIPPASLRRMNGGGELSRRRSSFGEQIFGDVVDGGERGGGARVAPIE
jgi:hypothetical protein